jgi:hypothetical protein
MRSLLYKVARLLGDAAAIKKGKVTKRVKRRLLGRVAGKIIRRW